MKSVFTIERFETLLAAYGTRLELWPEAERDAARKLLESSSEARQLLHGEAGLDALFAAAQAPELSPDFSRRLAELPLKHAQPRKLWPFRSVWLPAAAWAAAAVFGVLLGGVALPDDVSEPADAAAVSAVPDESGAADGEGFGDEEERELLEMALGPGFVWEESP
jgi:hypothetical protein